jgi:hypothetical protein
MAAANRAAGSRDERVALRWSRQQPATPSPIPNNKANHASKWHTVYLLVDSMYIYIYIYIYIASWWWWPSSTKARSRVPDR